MHSREFVIVIFRWVFRHMELEMSRFSFYLVKVQTEKGIGMLVGETTNKENISVIKRIFLTIP